MAFVNAKTGKKIKLDTGYTSNPIDYQTWKRQQEAKRAEGQPPARSSSTGGSPAPVKTKRNTSTATANQGKELPSPSSLGRQYQEALGRAVAAPASPSRMLQTPQTPRTLPKASGYSLKQGLADVFKKGANQFAQAGADTLALAEDVINAPFELFSGMELGSLRNSGEGIFNPLREKVQAEGTALAEKSAENVRKGGKAAAALDKYGTATVAAVPQAVIAMLTGGASASAQAAAQTTGGVARAAATELSPGIARTIQNAVGGLARDPQFWSSFSQVVGSGYEQALEDGANAPKAALYAVGNGLMNAAVEVGGGIQTLPGELQAGASGWMALVDSALDEGKEEVIQGVIERAMQNLTYQKGNPLVSAKNPDAVFNPLTAVEEFAGGAVVGGILSGGQIAANRALSGADAHVRGTLDMMQRAAGRETTQGAAQEAPGARQASGASVDAARVQSPAEAAQMGPRDILMDAARRGGKLKDGPDMQKELARFQLKEAGAEEKAAPGTGTADMSLVERIQQSVPQLQGMEPVANIRGNELPSGGKLIDRLTQFAASFGNKVFRPGFGEVFFSRGKLKSSMIGHGMGGAKIETFPAVPAIIQRGQQVDFQPNWKGRNYDTYTFAAPVNYKGNQTYIGVIVAKDKQSSRYYLHEVVDEHGNVIFQNTEAPTAVQDGTSALSGDLDTVPAAGAAPMSASDGTSALLGDLDTVAGKKASAEGTRPLNVDSTISQRADSVKPEGIMEREIRRLFGGGKRLFPDALTVEQMAAVEAANGQGTVDMDAENRLYQVNPEEHIDRRDIQSAGDKRLRAFQFDHPQLHPYYVQAAQALSAELEHYIPGGETASRVSEDGNPYSYRMSRSATPRIAELIDRYGVKPGQIGRAIEAIINDRGQENYAAAKRLELMLDEMLTNGYQDALSGEFVQPNQEYIDLKGKIAGAMDRAADMGHGLDGIGAADAGSLNSDYDRLQAQSSRFHPEGPNAARPVDVPTQDFDRRNISKSASTMMGAKILDDADVARLEQLVADGGFSFDTIHDKDALQRARETVQDIGFDRALERYIQTAQANTATKDNTVLGQVLMLEAARGGNRNALAEIAALYARNSTNIAQAMQAQSILRQLGPEARLYNLQKSVNELAEKYQVDIELDQAALEDFVNAENEEARQAAEARLIQAAASQLPTTFRAKYDAVRYLAMLGNPRTHIRNILGNFFFQIPATLKNRVGALGEVTARALGADVERTKSLTGASPFGVLAKEARADWANAKPFLEGGKYSEGKVTVGAIEQEAKPFQNSNALGRGIGALADWNGDWLEREDNFFKQWIYSQSLAGYLKANGVKSISEASPELLSRARNYAAQEALRNTFNDRNDVSDFVAKLGNLRNSQYRTGRALSYLTEGLLPFKRTPANVLARAVEYTFVGSGLDILNTFRDAQAGKMNQETVLKHLDRQAAGLSGTALMVLGALASGSITGGEDEDEDQRRFDDLTGHQSYALELNNGTSITLDWLAPEAIPFFMGVELAHAAQDGGLNPEDFLTAVKNMGEPMLEMSMLQGLNDVFENAAYAQQHGGSVMGSAVVSAATGYLTQVFPTLLGQLERTTEGRRMTTYADKNDRISKDLQFFMGKLSQKVPGWDYHQIPYLDAWGREEETGDALQRAINNLANPAYVSQVQVDQVERELQRLKDATGNGGVFPKRAEQYFTVDKERKDLTAEEYQKYAKKRGQVSLEVLRSMLDSPGYQKLSDEKKAEAISDVYQYADAMGKMEVSSYRPGDGTVAAGALKTMLPPASYILYRLNKDRDGDGKVTNLESTQTLQELPELSVQQRGEAWEAMNKQTSPARNPFTGVLAEKKGMTPEKSAAAWGIYGRNGTKEEPYTQERKKEDLQQELGLSYIDAAQLYELMKKAAKGK